MNANNLNHFLDKANDFTAKADAIRNAVAVLIPFANDNGADDAPPPAAPIIKAKTSVVAVPVVEVANDNAAHALPPPPSIAAATSGKGGRSKLADSNLIDALTTRNQKPTHMVETLAKMGITVSKSLIYQRMPKLAAALPDLIEAHGKAWRIKSKPAPDASTKVRKTAASAAAPRRGKVGKAKAITISTESPTSIAKPKASARKREAPTKKSSHNQFASCAKLMASLLTNEWKSVATLIKQARNYGWNGPTDLAARALDGLVRSGLANCRSVGGAMSYLRA